MAEYSDKLGAYDEAVVFDDATADRLISAAQTLSSTLTTQGSDRTSWATTASTDFKGHYADVFDTNSKAGSTDCTNISSALNDLVSEVQALKTAAAAERSRRAQAKEWADRQDHETFLKKGWDWLTSQDQAPPGPDQVPLPQPHEPVTSSWSEPAPAASGSVSSACPQDLRTYATNISGANDTVVTQKGTLDGAISDFATACAWCTIDASGITAALTSFTSNNTGEAAWVNTVADAFEAAGGGDGGISTVSDEAIAACLEAAGVAENRKPLDVASPQIMGDPQTSGYADDPVNTTTGNFVEPEADLVFTRAGASLEFERVYNSVSSSHDSDDAPGAGAFGPGWSSTADERLVVDDEGATWVRATGRHVVFPRAGAGWGRAVGENLWLEALDAADSSDSTAAGARGAGGFVVSDNEGGRWCFDVAGRPAWWSRGAGTRVERSYDSSGRLAGLAHERGRGVDVVWDGAGSRIVALVARDGRRADFSYDSSGRLVGVTRSGGGARRYEWGEESGRIERVVDADGVVEADNAYDEAGRVVRQRSAFGRVSHYSYLPGGVTQVADADGSRANVWVHDARGRLTGMIDAAGQRQSISWDRWGNRVMITGRDGGRTINQYDERGRLSVRVEETGARLSYDYDDADRVVRVRADDGSGAAAVTAYEYAGADRNPRMITDPEGGVTRLDWEDGLLVGVVDPVGVRVRLGYDEHGELTSVTNAVGDTARLERDGAGRITASITPSGRRTQYRYDAAGNLVSRRDPDGATWRWEHTPGGRPCAEIDPAGHRKTCEYGEHGEQTEYVDPLGERLRNRWDDVGNLAETVMPDGTSWAYTYDALSRLVAVKDPANAVWRNEYDVVGRLTATVDPTGVRREQGVSAHGMRRTLTDGAATSAVTTDALGRITAVTGDDGADRVTRYDLCGRPVEYVDAEGGSTVLERDPAGKVVRLVRPSGEETRYEWDECGRLSAVIDAAGGASRFEYNADSLLVREIWPTGEASWFRYDPCGRVAAKHVPGYGTTCYERDLSGRVVVLVDPACGRRRFRYNEVGNLVEAVAGTGAVTRYEYDSMGVLVAVIDPLGGVTRYERDARGDVVRLVDPLGRETTARYDAAGRQVSQRDAAGHVTDWEYDANGWFAAMSYDGVEHHRVERDFAARTMRITQAGGHTMTVRWDGAGRLVSRSSDGRTVEWGYDGDGRRVWMRAPDGAVTDYAYDGAGRLVRVENSAFGRVVYEHDASGRMVSATAGDVRQEWVRGDGFVTEHLVHDLAGGGISHTSVGRDEAGRVTWTSQDGSHTDYAYDGANQLVGAVVDGIASAYVYDDAGRLVEEIVDDGAGGTRRRTLTYDAAGQLVSTSGDGAVETRFVYDAAGRRVREERADGGVRVFAWGALARLESVSIDGALEKWRTSLLTDALGELAAVDGARLDWDSASAVPGLLGVDGRSAVGVPGFTAVGDGWRVPGWRDARSDGADPWGGPGGADGPDGPGGGVSWGAGGELGLPGGLEWLGARVYDRGTRGFLSRDPLEATAGAGWAGNPYSYAGNNPVGMSDPSGRHPLTDAELASWKDSHKTGLAAAGAWVADNWEYLVAGAAIVAGVALMFTGVGGPAGLALMSVSGALVSGGISIAEQKHGKGSVDWGAVGREAAIGAIPFPGGGAAAAGREAAEQVGREALEAGTREAVEAAARSAGERELGAVGREAVESAGDRAAQEAAEWCHGAACFAAGTGVLMADGTVRPIEDVAAGDRVAACDPVTGEARARTVTATASHDDVPVLRVRTDDGGAVETTATHPFWVEDRGWTPAGRLRAGDRLLTPDGRTVTVTATAPTGRTRRVYSLEVDGLQAYYVRAGTAFIAVHNECSELARQLQQRAEQLNKGRDAWDVRNGTTAVIQARGTIKIQTQGTIKSENVIVNFVATEGERVDPLVEGALRRGEIFVEGEGHAEQTIIDALDKLDGNWKIIAGGTSRNVCRKTCAPRIANHGLELTGPEFRGMPDKTPYRMFQIPGLGH